MRRHAPVSAWRSLREEQPTRPPFLCAPAKQANEGVGVRAIACGTGLSAAGTRRNYV